MVYAGARVVAIGRVVSARAEGMGIVFTKVEQRYQAILKRWIAESPVNCSGPYVLRKTCWPSRITGMWESASNYDENKAKMLDSLLVGASHVQRPFSYCPLART
jgi:hypothetical protein